MYQCVAQLIGWHSLSQQILFYIKNWQNPCCNKCCKLQCSFWHWRCCQSLLGSVGHFQVCYAGLVSLTLLDKPVFGPPHLHMQQPTRSHFIGDLSPQGNPLHYLASVRSLYDWYWNHCGSKQQGSTVKPPLVVNTHGWIKVHRHLLSLCLSHS